MFLISRAALPLSLHRSPLAYPEGGAEGSGAVGFAENIAAQFGEQIGCQWLSINETC